MKVLLIYPSSIEIYGRFKPAAKLAAQPQMPLGILYIGAALEKSGHQVNIIDCDVDQRQPSDILDEIARWNPAVVGVSATTPVYPMARQIVKQVKEKHPTIITVLGGYHITALPQETMEESALDFGVYGEGEATMVELLAALEQKTDIDNIPGIVYRRDDEIVLTPPRPLIPDLDTIPFPGRHMIRYPKYVWSVPQKGLVPVTTVLTQRGCPFQCAFCGSHTMFPKVRYRQMTSIVDELEHIARNLNIHHIQFSDDTMTLNANKVMAMCAEIKRRQLDITWEGYTRADCISKELLATMKEAGLVRLSFGVESGDPEILKAVNKGITLEQYRQAYDWCAELRIESRCSVMIGHPFETKKTIKTTIDFICSLPIDQAYINITMPYPGSNLLELARSGYGGLHLLSENWGDYRRYGNAVMEMNDLTREDLIRLQKQAYMKFYFRPKIIWKNLNRAGLRAGMKNAIGFAQSLFKPTRS